MNRPTCQEDMYEYRVKRIFNSLRADWKDEESEAAFQDWLNNPHNAESIAATFLEDVETYMGLPICDDE